MVSGGGFHFSVNLNRLWKKLTPEPPPGPEENPYDLDRAFYRQELEEGRMRHTEFAEHMKALDDLERLWRHINGKE
jgi:hypothetical protein